MGGQGLCLPLQKEAILGSGLFAGTACLQREGTAHRLTSGSKAVSVGERSGKTDGKAGLQPFLWEFWAMQVSTRVGYPKSSQEARSKEKQIVAFPWRVQHCPPCTHAHSEEKSLPNMVNEHHTEGLKVTKTPECTATCIQRAEVREAARRPTLRRAASITELYSPKCQQRPGRETLV